MRERKPDEIAVREHRHGCVRMCLSQFLDRTDRARLRFAQRLPVREAHIAWPGAQVLPELGASEHLERSALQISVMDLTEFVAHADPELARARKRLRGLDRALERARIDRVDRQAVQARDQPVGLRAPALGQVHTGRPAGQPRRRVSGQTMSDQQQQHGRTIPTLSASSGLVYTGRMAPTLYDRIRSFAMSLPDAYEDHPWGESVAKVDPAR